MNEYLCYLCFPSILNKADTKFLYSPFDGHSQSFLLGKHQKHKELDFQKLKIVIIENML